MKTWLLRLSFVGLLLAPTAADASVIYSFGFTALRGFQGDTYADFSIALTYDDYVMTTGMGALPGAPYATTLGYSVNYAGTNNQGWWGFDDDGTATLSNAGVSFCGGMPENCRSFVFQPSSLTSGYFNAPGTHSGSVIGNLTNASFRGSGLLTISETSAPVPEPASLLLFGTGLVGVRAWRKRRQ